jgi:hypothetical protein
VRESDLFSKRAALYWRDLMTLLTLYGSREKGSDDGW